MNAIGESLMDSVREARREIERCRDAPAAEAKKTFGRAMLQIIRARNERLREQPAGGADNGELQQLNGILSLMASIEFPLGGFHRSRLEQVVQALRALGGAGA